MLGLYIVRKWGFNLLRNVFLIRVNKRFSSVLNMNIDVILYNLRRRENNNVI